MNAQAILDKIGQDAGDAALRIADDAQVKIAQMRAASGAKIEAQHAALLSRAQRESDELEQRMLRMAELDSRKALLAKKRALMDEAFTRAGAKLAKAPVEEKRAFFLRMVARNAAGTEALLASANAPWFDDAFLAEANAALAKAGKPADLTLATERARGGEGVTLRLNGAETRLTLDVLLDESRAAMEQQVAAVLFD